MVNQIEFKFVEGGIELSRVHNIFPMSHEQAVEMSYILIDEMSSVVKMLVKEIILR
jgi:hypothetical protein